MRGQSNRTSADKLGYTMAMAASIARLASSIAYGKKRVATMYSRYKAAYSLILHVDISHLIIDFQNSAGYMNLNTKL